MLTIWQKTVISSGSEKSFFLHTGYLLRFLPIVEMTTGAIRTFYDAITDTNSCLNGNPGMLEMQQFPDTFRGNYQNKAGRM